MPHLPRRQAIELSGTESSPIKQEMPAAESGSRPRAESGAQTKENEKPFTGSNCSVAQALTWTSVQQGVIPGRRERIGVRPPRGVVEGFARVCAVCRAGSPLSAPSTLLPPNQNLDGFAQVREISVSRLLLPMVVEQPLVSEGGAQPPDPWPPWSPGPLAPGLAGCPKAPVYPRLSVFRC